MSARAMKIGLIVLAIVNVFALAAVVTMAVSLNRIETRVEEQHRPGRSGSSWDMLAELSPEVRARVRAGLRDAALVARPDFEEARTARRAAVLKAQETAYDGAAVRALLAASSEAELRGRAKLEAGTVALLETLTPEERQMVAPLLSRHGPRIRERGRGGNRPPRDGGRQEMERQEMEPQDAAPQSGA